MSQTRFLMLRSPESLLLSFGIRRCWSCVNIFFSRTARPILTKFGMQHLQGKDTRNCKFHYPPPNGGGVGGGGNQGVKSEKLIYFVKNLLFYSDAWFIKTKCIVMMTKKGSTKIINFMTPGAGVLVQGRLYIEVLAITGSFKCYLYTKGSKCWYNQSFPQGCSLL